MTYTDHEHTMPPIRRARGKSVRSVGADASLRVRIHALGLRSRTSPKVRSRAELQVVKMKVDEWMHRHGRLRKVEVPAGQRASLREVFDMIDADHGGTIDLEEMSVIMRAQGFTLEEIKEAMRIGDTNGDGELDFEEFVALVGTIGTSVCMCVPSLCGIRSESGGMVALAVCFDGGVTIDDRSGDVRSVQCSARGRGGRGEVGGGIASDVVVMMVLMMVVVIDGVVGVVVDVVVGIVMSRSSVDRVSGAVGGRWGVEGWGWSMPRA